MSLGVGRLVLFTGTFAGSCAAGFGGALAVTTIGMLALRAIKGPNSSDVNLTIGGYSLNDCNTRLKTIAVIAVALAAAHVLIPVAQTYMSRSWELLYPV